MKTTGADNWQRDIERERLSIERTAAEDRRNEIVARLAIELGRPKAGRPKAGRVTVVPDVGAAVRLLSDAAAARVAEASRAARELKTEADSILSEIIEGLNPSLRWQKAGRGVAVGSGGLLSCSVLCDESAGPDTFIYVSRLFVNFPTDATRWERLEKLGRWEVMRDASRFCELVRAALDSMRGEEMRSNPKGNLPSVTDADVSKVLKMGEISDRFFRALVLARKAPEKRIDKGLAGGEAKPPRGKRAKR